MTISGFAQEKEKIASFFENAWSETSIVWPGKTFKRPDSGSKPWVEFNIVNGDSSQMSVGAPGNNVFRHPGIVSILILVPVGKGEDELLRLADKVYSVFRSFSIEYLAFSPPTFNKLGAVDGYFQGNVSVPFNRDSNF